MDLVLQIAQPTLISNVAEAIFIGMILVEAGKVWLSIAKMDATIINAKIITMFQSKQIPQQTFTMNKQL